MAHLHRRVAGVDFVHGVVERRDFEQLLDRLGVLGRGGEFANYNAWTDAAIAIADRELSNRGISITNDADKSLKLAITFVKTTATILTLEYKTVVKMKVETGNGYAAEYAGINKSFYWFDLKRQSDGAVMRTVVAMLQDQKIIDYLTSP